MMQSHQFALPLAPLEYKKGLHIISPPVSAWPVGGRRVRRAALQWPPPGPPARLPGRLARPLWPPPFAAAHRPPPAPASAAPWPVAQV